MDPTDLKFSGAAPLAADDAPAAEARREPPFVLIEPLHRTAPIVFASPHSGRQWEGPEALAHHFTTAHMARFMTEVPAMVAGPFEINRYEIASVAPL